jgi:Ca2+-binding EF-hand superfamily protein
MPKKGSGKSKLSAELVEKYGEAFDAIDEDGKGTISKGELTSILGGNDIGEEAIAAALAKFDTDHDGEMDKDEYFDFVYGSMLENARAFLKAADTSGDGKISKDELAGVFAQLGFPEGQAAEAMANADDDGSGSLSVDELCDYLLEV